MTRRMEGEEGNKVLNIEKIFGSSRALKYHSFTSGNVGLGREHKQKIHAVASPGEVTHPRCTLSTANQKVLL